MHFFSSTNIRFHPEKHHFMQTKCVGSAVSLTLNLYVDSSAPRFKLASYKRAVAESQYLIGLLQLSSSIYHLHPACIAPALLRLFAYSSTDQQREIKILAAIHLHKGSVHVSRASLRHIMWLPCNSSFYRTNNTHLIRADDFVSVMQCGVCYVCVF